MRKQLAQLDEFNQAYETFVSSKPVGYVQVWDLRAKLLREEVEEYSRAAFSNNVIEVADALADILYVLLGTVYAHGLQDHFEELFTEVHSSNMSKLGEDGKPILREDGKVIKGPNYFKPNIRKVLDHDS